MSAAEQRKHLDRLSASLQRLRTRPDQRGGELPAELPPNAPPNPFAHLPGEPQIGDDDSDETG